MKKFVSLLLAALLVLSLTACGSKNNHSGVSHKGIYQILRAEGRHHIVIHHYHS